MVFPSLLLCALCSVGFANSDCDSPVSDGHAMLQMARAREMSTMGSESGDTSSLLAMKAQLKSKIERGEELTDEEKVFFQDFMNFLENTSLKNINETHKTDQQEIYDTAAQVSACNEQLAAKLSAGGIWQVASHSEQLSQGTHTLCREDEQKKWKETNSTCWKLDEFALELETPTAGKGPKEVDWEDAELVTFLNAFSTYFCDPIPDGDDTRLEKFEDLSSKCRNASKDAMEFRAICNQNQKDYEKKACSQKEIGDAACGGLDLCYSHWSSEFDKIKSQKIADNEYLKVEYQIVKTIICYIRLLMEGNDALTTVNKERCEERYPDGFLDLSIPVLADKTECEASHDYPCQESWVSRNYDWLLASDDHANAQACSTELCSIED